jgi:hypothetical protein
VFPRQLSQHIHQKRQDFKRKPNGNQIIYKISKLDVDTENLSIEAFQLAICLYDEYPHNPTGDHNIMNGIQIPTKL